VSALRGQDCSDGWDTAPLGQQSDVQKMLMPGVGTIVLRIPSQGSCTYVQPSTMPCYCSEAAVFLFGCRTVVMIGQS
jgi:hypothetical protein